MPNEIDTFTLYAKDKVTKARIEKIGQLMDRANALLNSPVRDVDAIRTLAIEMREFGLKKKSRMLLDAIE